MIHAAAKKESPTPALSVLIAGFPSWPCPSTPSTPSPALVTCPWRKLSRNTYNITAFNPSVEETRDLVLKAFPGADITFKPDLKRQAIVDFLAADVDDTAARTHHFQPKLGLQAFSMNT